jgi:uncharacterized protein YbjT (DUF2867 family)
VEHLLRHGHTPHVLTRDKDKAAQLQAAGAVPVIVDLADVDGIYAASQEVDSVAFLVPAFLDDPTDALKFAKNAVNAAASAGVEMFAWNASGEISDEISASNTKLSILSHLRESGLPFVVFEPTTYMENWLGPWTAPSIRNNDELTYPVLADRRMGWIASDDVCALVVAALERPNVAGSRFRISGIETPTGPELAAHFSDVLGRNIRYRTLSPKEMGAVLDEAFGPGAGDRVAEMYRREQEDPDPPDKFHDMTSVLEALSVRMSTIQEWVAVHKDTFV